jgi:hypothetical protein
MARRARAIAAAELRVVQSRSDLRTGWRRVRSKLSQPPFLAAAAAAGVLVGFSLTRRGRTLAAALVRLGVEYLIARALPSRRISPP